MNIAAMQSNGTVARPVMLAMLVIACTAGGSSSANGDFVAVRPNVVLMLIDDLGWSDLRCYGSRYYQTPHIDQLAADGVRFTDAYSACNVCSPTRAAIMTGKYPARLLLTQWLPAGRWDAEKSRMREARYLSDLPLEEVTLAESLREAGYRTGFVGKWHLGSDSYYSPLHHGFDANIAGRDYGAPGSYFYPYEGTWKIPGTGQTYVKRDLLPGKEGDYLTDRLTDEAIKFIRESRDQSFFLMLSHYAVHTPLEGKPDKLGRYRAVKKKDRQGRPEYAAMIESVDDSVGRVMHTLAELNLLDNTLVVFTSDNGGFAGATSNTPLRANKGSNYEGGIRVPLLIQWTGQIAAGVCDVPVTSTDFYPTILDAVNEPLQPNQHTDGESLMPLLRGTGTLSRSAIYWHYPHYNQHPSSFPSGAIRNDHWKLLENYETGERELYNLASDLGETNNVAAEHPDTVALLSKKLEAWRQDVGADPMRPNPQFREAATTER